MKTLTRLLREFYGFKNGDAQRCWSTLGVVITSVHSGEAGHDRYAKSMRSRHQSVKYT
jgi:hypothetical protein